MRVLNILEASKLKITAPIENVEVLHRDKHRIPLLAGYLLNVDICVTQTPKLRGPGKAYTNVHIKISQQSMLGRSGLAMIPAHFVTEFQEN